MFFARELLMEKLREIGADGLCHPALECGCSLDDFEPCLACEITECVAARKVGDRFFPLGDGGDVDEARCERLVGP